MDDAVLTDTLSSLFCLFLLLSMSLATKECMMVGVLLTKLSAEPAFNLKMLN
jgi:hypothetical protein